MSQHWIRWTCQQVLSMKVSAACGWTSRTLVEEVFALYLGIKCLKIARFESSKNPNFFFFPQETISPFSTLAGAVAPEWVSRSSLMTAHQQRVLLFDVGNCHYCEGFVFRDRVSASRGKGSREVWISWHDKSNTQGSVSPAAPLLALQECLLLPHPGFSLPFPTFQCLQQK